MHLLGIFDLNCLYVFFIALDFSDSFLEFPLNRCRSDVRWMFSTNITSMRSEPFFDNIDMSNRFKMFNFHLCIDLMFMLRNNQIDQPKQNNVIIVYGHSSYLYDEISTCYNAIGGSLWSFRLRRCIQSVSYYNPKTIRQQCRIKI